MGTISHSRGILGRIVVGGTPPTLVSMSSSPSPKSGKLYSMSVHASVHENYRNIGRLCPISHSRGILARAVAGRFVVGGLPNAHTPTLVSINSSPSPVSAKHCSMSVHSSMQNLELTLPHN